MGLGQEEGASCGTWHPHQCAGRPEGSTPWCPPPCHLSRMQRPESCICEGWWVPWGLLGCGILSRSSPGASRAPVNEGSAVQWLAPSSWCPDLALCVSTAESPVRVRGSALISQVSMSSL